MADPFAFVFIGLPIKSVFIYLHCQDETLSERMSQRCEWRAKKNLTKTRLLHQNSSSLI